MALAPAGVGHWKHQLLKGPMPPGAPAIVHRSIPGRRKDPGRSCVQEGVGRIQMSFSSDACDRALHLPRRRLRRRRFVITSSSWRMVRRLRRLLV